MLNWFLQRLQSSLLFKLNHFLGLSILAGIILFSFYSIYYQSRALRESARREIIDLSGIVKRNTRRGMQSNYPEGINDIINTAGEQKNILEVLIYNRAGTVRYASDPLSVGVTVEMTSPSCIACHEGGRMDVDPRQKEKTFSGSYQGRETISIVTPIFGEQSCYQASCHYHPPEHAMLGILEIHRSVDDLTAIVAKNTKQTLLFGGILLLMISSMAVFFILRFIYRPVMNLLGATSRISHGEYGVEAQVLSPDEFGQLTMAFNEMSLKIEERQHELLKSREEFKTLFNDVPASIVVCDKDFRIKNTNKMFKDVFGDCIDQHCFAAQLGRQEACDYCPAIDTVADGLVHSIEQERKLPDGKRHTFLVHTAPIRDEAGGIGMIMEIATDVTRIKELQDELAVLGETVAGISHTIKNILGGLEGGMHLVDLALSKGNESRLRKGWEMVGRNIKRISHLVHDILYFSKERPPELQQTDPAEVCRDVMELMQGKATEAGVQIRLEMPGNRGMVRIDPKGLHTVLVNLMGNAIEACAEDESSRSSLVVLTYRHDAQGPVLFEVADNGPGMPSEIKDKLFQRFFSTKGSKGSGLGLLVTKKIVEEHGGRINVQSTEGSGTVFTVSFPNR
jgi:PAS domain S-box-containing protein